MSIRVLLADDHDMVRAGLRALLEKQSDIEVVAEAGDGQMTLEMVEKHSPTIVVLDVAMPGLNGIDVARKIAANWPNVKVIALSMHAEAVYVREMLRAGAAGYLTKSGGGQELIQAIRHVSAGRGYLSPAITQYVVDQIVDASQADQSSLASLSPGEREVLQFIAEGLNSKEIAHRLDVSARTVDARRQKVMEKLDLHSVADLTRYAIREGLTPLGP